MNWLRTQLRQWLGCPAQLELTWLRDELVASYVQESRRLGDELKCADIIPYWPTITRQAAARGFDRFLVAGLIEAESAFHRYAEGDAGASRGLMQLSWPAYQDVRDAQVTQADWRRETFDAHLSIALGLDYLGQCRSLCAALGETDLKWALAMYNWGKGNIRDHLRAGKSWGELPEFRQRVVFRYLECAENFRKWEAGYAV